MCTCGTDFHPRHFPGFRLGFEDGVRSLVQGGLLEASKVVATLDYTCSDGLVHREHAHTHTHTQPSNSSDLSPLPNQPLDHLTCACCSAQSGVQFKASTGEHMVMPTVPSRRPVYTNCSFLSCLPSGLTQAPEMGQVLFQVL